MIKYGDDLVSISSTFFAQFFLYESAFFAKTKKAAKTTFAQKTRAKNVDEIDYWCQFHQHSTSSFSLHIYQKRQKISKLTVFFALSRSVNIHCKKGSRVSMRVVGFVAGKRLGLPVNNLGCRFDLESDSHSKNVTLKHKVDEC